MEVLKPGFNLDTFFLLMAAANNKALLLDYDGTLAPFKIDRAQAYPYPGINDVLDEIIEVASCRVVIISGRPVQEVISLLKLKRRPEIWGAHGWERLLPDDKYLAFKLNSKIENGLKQADEWVIRSGFKDRLDSKHGCLALHWRGLNNKTAENIRHLALESWNPIAESSGLIVKEFNGGIEIKAPGRNKGTAVNTIKSEIGTGVAAYLGDDLTDEDAFKALDNKDLKVLVNKHCRPSLADLWLTPPDELIIFLRRWLKTLSKSS